MHPNQKIPFSQLVGKTIHSITGATKDSERIIFETSDGKYSQYHKESCCETVCVEDVSGDINDILNSPILQAEETSNKTEETRGGKYEHRTWTFYKIATIKGYVTIRWYGSSNGCYAEEALFEKIEE